MANKRNEIELRHIREAIYAKEVYHATFLFKPDALRHLSKDYKGKVLHVPSASLRANNFKLLVENNFNRDFEPSPWPVVKENLRAYQNFKAYSATDYGAAMIHRILDDNKNKTKENRFQIRYDDGTGGEFAKAGYNFVMVSKNFPNGERFPGGEVKYALAIIHHEFGHTRFFTDRSGPIQFRVEHERKAVLENSNPVRILYDVEPRYTYTDKAGQTINIINGKKCVGNCTIMEDDPRVLVPKTAKGARKW